MVGVEDGAGFGDLETVVRADAPRQLDDRVEPCADPPVLRALFARALEATQLTLDGHLHGVGCVDLGQPRAIPLVSLVAVALTQLLADGRELLPEQEFALGLLHPLGHVVSDAVAQRQVGQHLALPRQHQGEACLDVGLLEDLDLLLEAEVRRIAGGVGHGARVGYAPEGLGDLTRAAVLEHVLDDGPVLPGQLDGALGGHGVVDRLDLDPEGATGARHAGADACALDAAYDYSAQTTRQLAGRLHGGDGADVGVPAVLEPRHENQTTVVVAGSREGGPRIVAFHGHGHDHAREHDSAGQRQQGEVEGLQFVHSSQSNA